MAKKTHLRHTMVLVARNGSTKIKCKRFITMCGRDSRKQKLNIVNTIEEFDEICEEDKECQDCLGELLMASVAPY